MDELNERITDLEIRFTHQSRLLDELNDVLADACVRITRLEQENRGLREQLRQMSPDDYTLSPDE